MEAKNNKCLFPLSSCINFQDCGNKLIGWLKTIEMYSLTFLVARNLKSKCQHAIQWSRPCFWRLQGMVLLASSSFSHLPTIFAVPLVCCCMSIYASISVWPSFLVCFCVFVHKSPSSSSYKHQSLDLAHLNPI